MKVERKSVIRIVLGGFILFLLIYVYMFTGERFLNACRPMFLGVCIAYPLNIMIGWFRRHDILYNRKILKSEKLHRILSAALAVVVLLICLGFIIGYLIPQLTGGIMTVLEKVPSGVRYLLTQPIVIELVPEDTMEALRKIDWTKWINHLVSLVNSDDLIRSMTSTASSALSVFSIILFGILFACYFLSGKEKAASVVTRMTNAFAPERYRKSVFHAGRVLNECFHDFIVCQATQALIIGVSTTLLMAVFRFPYASMIGTLNGFCALVPIIGGYIGATLGTLMILADAPGMALFFLLFIIALQNLIGTLVFPRLIGRSLGLPGVWTLTAVLIGSGVAGIMGILLGVPMVAFCYRMVSEKLREREAQAAAGGPDPAAAADPVPESGEPLGEHDGIPAEK